MAVKRVKLPDNTVQDIHDARIAAIDPELSGQSSNPVENCAIDAEFEKVTYLGDTLEEVDPIDDEPEPEPIIIIGGEDNVYFATYGVTTYSVITTQINSGKLVVCKNEILGATAIYYHILTANGVHYFGSSGNDAIDTVTVNQQNEWSVASITVEKTTNKSTSITSSSTNAEYPSALAVKTYVDTMCGNIESLLSDI